MKKICVLDIETTGFSHDKDCILEIGMVELNLETGEVKPLLDEVFRENKLSARHHKAWIFENGFMTLEEVRKAPLFENISDKVQDILLRYEYVSAWNSAFDMGFLLSRGFSITNELPCPMKTSADWFGIKNKWGKTGKWASVDEAWKHLFGEDTGYNEIHRGADDAAHEAKIMYELYKKKVIWQK